MTTEEAFQAHLDEHPDDHTARLVFADYLDERDDPRAAGYRALGLLRRWPYEWMVNAYGYHTGRGTNSVMKDGSPAPDLQRHIPRHIEVPVNHALAEEWIIKANGGFYTVCWVTEHITTGPAASDRRIVDDIVARAFGTADVFTQERWREMTANMTPRPDEFHYVRPTKSVPSVGGGPAGPDRVGRVRRRRKGGG